jgi:type IX secretion system PorP/SprF family membrane protein
VNIYLNPSSVGNLKSWTISHQFRNQWPESGSNYITNNAAVQYGFNKTFKGIGVSVLNDVAGDGIINSTRISVPIAFCFKIKDLVEVNLGLETAFLQKSADWSKLTFGSMINNQLGFVADSSDSFPATTVNNLDFAIGMEVKIAKFKIGLAGTHLFEPNESFFGETSTLPFRLTTYVNYDFSRGNQLIVSPSVLYQQQRDFTNLIVSTTTTYKFVKLLVGYRYNDAIIMGAGVKFSMFDIGYTYDLTTSQLSNATGGSHELGVRFRFGKSKEGDFDNAF